MYFCNPYFFFIFGLFGCNAPKNDDDTGMTEDENSTTAYGSCSIDVVSSSGSYFSVQSQENSTIELHIAFLHEQYGEQLEEHPLSQSSDMTEGMSWSIDLTTIDNPDNLVEGTTTLWDPNILMIADLVCVAFNTEDEPCDCWDLHNDYGNIGCGLYGLN